MPAYVGWVPNVAGRLSFSHLGNTRNPGACSRINDGDSTGRLLICYQYRRSSDTLLRPAYLQYVYGQRANIAFVLCAESAANEDGSDVQGVMKGRLYLIDETAPDRLPFRPWAVVEEQWSELRKTHAQPARHPAARQALLKELDEAFAPKAFGSFAVSLHRDGVLELEPDENVCALSAAGFNGPHGDDITGYIANQAYFFIKDIAHTHRHHPASADSITTASPSPPQDWAANTLFGLHRKVVDLRRTGKAPRLFNALGVLAYISSFSAIAEVRVGKKPHLTYNTKQIEDAIKAHLEAAKWRQVQWNIIKTALPALLIALMNFGGESGISKAASHWVTALFPNDFFGWALASLFVVATSLYYQVIDPWMIPGSQRAKRIFAALDRQKQAIVWLLIACLPVFLGLLDLIFGGRIDVAFYWTVAFWSAAGWVALLWSLPYLVTADDAFKAMRKRARKAQSA